MGYSVVRLQALKNRMQETIVINNICFMIRKFITEGIEIATKRENSFSYYYLMKIKLFYGNGQSNIAADQYDLILITNDLVTFYIFDDFSYFIKLDNVS